MNYLVIISFSLLTLMTKVAFGETYYIHQNGVDNPECSLANPCLTWEGLDAVSVDGDEYEMAPLKSQCIPVTGRSGRYVVYDAATNTPVSSHNELDKADNSAKKQTIMTGNEHYIQAPSWNTKCE